MRYKLQIAGWLVTGILSIYTGYLEGAQGLGYRFLYLGIIAVIISALTYYITNRTKIVDKMLAKSVSKNSQRGSNL
jgi:hypothetical protein